MSKSAIVGIVLVAILFYVLTSARVEVKEKSSCGCQSKNM